MRIITKDESRNIDKISIENYNISQSSLMTAAANGIASHIEKYSTTKNKKPRWQQFSSNLFNKLIYKSKK